jgi:hypothetical protein
MSLPGMDAVFRDADQIVTATEIEDQLREAGAEGNDAHETLDDSRFRP